MAENFKPEADTICVECRQPIGDRPYFWAKSRGCPPAFIHKECWEKLLPKSRKKARDTRRGSE